ncbi:DUF6438 domain-containing protein [Fulvivirgaceae bacterium BMA10]|uniref:DUF6438 domain-containing protein n=1 Tax=Splendidivirga corallicola TaxID=3051826 RepID=A0ABT8KQG1_9BACT|nr:DUF6438 domain-containing protein [Fulvivirgaceae bacterium BMA10]
MRKTNLLIILISILISCRATKEEIDSDVVISMQKTNCLGNCPVYTIDIYESGLVILDGKENIDKLGEFKIKLSKNELKRLIDLFNAHDFFSFEEKYISNMTDLPTTYLYFADDNRRKRVMDYDGAPESLKKLESEVAKLIQIPNWKKVKRGS